MKLKGIPANVVVFGFVSFLTDVSSDMIYPLLPVFLIQTLGAGQGFVGLIEGFAESTAALFTLLQLHASFPAGFAAPTRRGAMPMVRKDQIRRRDWSTSCWTWTPAARSPIAL